MVRKIVNNSKNVTIAIINYLLVRELLSKINQMLLQKQKKSHCSIINGIFYS